MEKIKENVYSHITHLVLNGAGTVSIDSTGLLKGANLKVVKSGETLKITGMIIQ